MDRTSDTNLPLLAASFYSDLSILLSCAGRVYRSEASKGHSVVGFQKYSAGCEMVP